MDTKILSIWFLFQFIGLKSIWEPALIQDLEIHTTFNRLHWKYTLQFWVSIIKSKLKSYIVLSFHNLFKNLSFFLVITPN